VSKLFRSAVVATIVAVGSACGGDSTGPNGGGGEMSAQIGGSVNWTANLSATAVLQNGVLALAGNGGSGANGFQINIGLIGVAGPGNYPMGAGNFNNVGTVTSLVVPPVAWVSSGVGGTGQVTITTLTASRVVGTFSFTGRATDGSTKTVASGQFDIDF